MSPARAWWRRAAAAVKDHKTIYLARLAAATNCGGGAAPLPPDLEAALIRATSHDYRASNLKPAARVLASARNSPAQLEPLMWALARRAGRTRNWAVALKALMLAHGLLLLFKASPGSAFGRLPFDLADFHDRRSSSLSAFVRAYFVFLDRRSTLMVNPVRDDLDRVEKIQELLDLLIQIRPLGDGMEIGLVLEAMDCVMIETFDLYSCICSGIAGFLVGVLRSPATEKRRGAKGIRVLRKAREQSGRLRAYFEVCRRLGVMNTTEYPVVESVSEEEIRDLERVVMGEQREMNRDEGSGGVGSGAVVTKKWVVFDDESEKVGSGMGLASLEMRVVSGNLINL